MTTPEPPVDDPTAAELAALRKEKADRDTAERKAKDDEAAATKAELETLRKEKADRDAADAKKVKPPTPKVDKPTDDDKPKERRATHGSARWFGDAAYDND